MCICMDSPSGCCGCWLGVDLCSSASALAVLGLLIQQETTWPTNTTMDLLRRYVRGLVEFKWMCVLLYACCSLF